MSFITGDPGCQRDAETTPKEHIPSIPTAPVQDVDTLC